MRVLAPLFALALLVAGCVSPTPANPYAENRAPSRDEGLAAELVEKASAVEASDEEQAEAHLRAALAADIFCAKAHNNLGVLLLRRGDLYGAATEFEWARKLLPGHPEPRVNLALTLERAGHYGAARDSYVAALEVYPGYIAATQGAARLAEGGDSETTGYARVLIEGTFDARPELDKEIQTVAQNWQIERMAVIDRNVLRIAAFELLHCDEIPPKVAINEGIELGKRFSTQNSGAFINGILDKIKNRAAEAAAAAAGKED